MEYILAVLTYEDGTFEVFNKVQLPLWITNSVFKMDHDSEGRCYCGGY